MKSTLLQFGLALALCLGFTGCVMPGQGYSQHPPRIYLMLVVPDGLQPESIGPRREAIVTYLLSTGLLASREDLVKDPAEADRIIRAELTEDGFKLFFVDPVTDRAVVYEPVDLPSDYGYYDGLIFTLAPGSRYPNRHHRDEHRPDKPADRPGESARPGKDQHHPQPGTPPDRPNWQPQPKRDHPPQNPNPTPNPTPDGTRTKPQPNGPGNRPQPNGPDTHPQPKAPDAHPQPGAPGTRPQPTPSGDNSHARNGDNRPRGDNSGAPRTLPPPHRDDSGRRNDDRKSDDAKKDDSSTKASNKADPAVVPAR